MVNAKTPKAVNNNYSEHNSQQTVNLILFESIRFKGPIKGLCRQTRAVLIDGALDVSDGSAAAAAAVPTDLR